MLDIKKYLPLILGVAIAIGILIGGKLNFESAPTKSFYNNNKLNKLIHYIEHDYVNEINTDSVINVVVHDILKHLDPHSVYIPKKEIQHSTEEKRGSFVGIGIQFYTYKDTIAVIRTIKNGPSAKIGIQGGDRIITANGDSIFGKQIKSPDVIKKLKGKINSKVTLEIYRRGEPKLLKFVVKRDKIPIKSIDAAYMLTEKLGYIKINRFAESTYKEFNKSIKKLQALGATQVALDLRNNLGGILNISKQIADEFIEKGKLILFTKNKNGDVKKYYATRTGRFEKDQVYVLINENSASASEVVAGALQDNDKGTIIGRRSYGKGLVQREIDLGDGSMVRLTVSKYYTPTGRSIQRPYTNGYNDYANEYFDRLNSGELLDPEKIKVDHSLKFKTPKGKTVYGGGGIIPDVFVPINNNMQNETLLFLQRHDIFGNFVFETLEKDRHLYNKTLKQDFINNFEVDDVLISAFRDYLNTLKINVEIFITHRNEIKQHIKATLANQLFGDGAFEEVLNQQDIMINKVITLSKNSK